MDHNWAVLQLKDFVSLIDALDRFSYVDGEAYDDLVSSYGSARDVADAVIAREPIMRELMNAALPGLADYQDFTGWNPYGHEYWEKIVRHRALQAKGIHELGVQARERLRPESPDLVADRFHPWVWEAAAPMWNAGSRQEAVAAAGRSVNARLQQKLRRHDISETDLCRQAFTTKPPQTGAARLRLQGDRNTDTWRSRQQGAMDFAAGCFEAIRNPAAHEHELEISDQVAMEQLAAFSLLARWIEECEVQSVEPASHRGDLRTAH